MCTFPPSRYLGSSSTTIGKKVLGLINISERNLTLRLISAVLAVAGLAAAAALEFCCLADGGPTLGSVTSSSSSKLRKTALKVALALTHI